MEKQPAVPGLRDAMKKVTRWEQFLAEVDAVVPWSRLLTLIEPRHPKVRRPPIQVETMLRVDFLQNWYALSDPMAQKRPSMIARRCAGLQGRPSEREIHASQDDQPVHDGCAPPDL